MRTFTHETVESTYSHLTDSVSCATESAESNEVKSSTDKNSASRYVRIELREDMLHRLIHQGALVVEHMRGMDKQTQQAIRVLLLDNLRGCQ